MFCQTDESKEKSYGFFSKIFLLEKKTQITLHHYAVPRTVPSGKTVA